MPGKRFLQFVASSVAAAVLIAGMGCVSVPGTSSSTTVVHRSSNAQVALVFVDDDRSDIQNYYHHHNAMKKAKKVKKGRKESPKHIKKYKRREHLPVDVPGHRLPQDLELRLVVLPDGYMRVRVGADVLLIDSRTRLIVDIVKDVAF